MRIVHETHVWPVHLFSRRHFLPLYYIYLVCNFLVCASHFNCFVFISCLWVSVSFRFCLLCVLFFPCSFPFQQKNIFCYCCCLKILSDRLQAKTCTIQTMTRWNVVDISPDGSFYPRNSISKYKTINTAMYVILHINTDTINAFAMKFTVRNKFIA